MQTTQHNIDAIIFEGGGVAGVAYAGAVKCLDLLGVLPNVKHFSGSSVGSQAATLLAVGYSGKEFEHIVLDTPIRTFMPKECFFSHVRRLLTAYGYYDSAQLGSHFELLVRAKMGTPHCTFADLWRQRHVHLQITGTCISTGKTVVFDRYQSPNMPLSMAVRISSAVPLLYTPVLRDDGMLYVDGGMLCNFPLEFTKKKGQTIALELRDDDTHDDGGGGRALHRVKDMKSYLIALVWTLYMAANATTQKEKSAIRTRNVHIIRLPTMGVGAFDVGLHKRDKMALVHSAYCITNNYIQQRLEEATP